MAQKKELQRYEAFSTNHERYEYLTTIIGIEGRIPDLDVLLARRSNQNGRWLPYGSHGTRLEYLPQKEQVEFDIYARTRPLMKTDTRNFRTGLGEIVMMLLQTGFTIKTEKRTEEQGAQPEIKLDF